MRTYEQAVYRVAKEYAREAHDNMFARVNMDKVNMIAFIFDENVELVMSDVMSTFVENREIFWR